MSRPPRLGGFPYEGLHRYFLTICTFNRQHVFTSDDVIRHTLLQFRKTATLEACELSAYCFMPDHVHFLIEALEDRSDFRRFCKLAKPRSGSAYVSRHHGRLWQEGHYDRILREDDDSRFVARYLLDNPVRAGLVNTPLDYPYLGSDRWSVKELIEAQQGIDPADGQKR